MQCFATKPKHVCITWKFVDIYLMHDSTYGKPGTVFRISDAIIPRYVALNPESAASKPKAECFFQKSVTNNPEFVRI